MAAVITGVKLTLTLFTKDATINNFLKMFGTSDRMLNHFADGGNTVDRKILFTGKKLYSVQLQLF